MCKLRRNFHSVMATRRYGPLPVQRVRSLPQDEWNESTFGEAATAIGKEGRKKIRKEGRNGTTKQSCMIGEFSSKARTYAWC